MKSEQAIKLLLIEDDLHYGQLLERLITENNDHSYQVKWAVNLTDGLTALEEQHFDIVLLDLMLPDSGGMATLDAVVKHCGPVPVLVLTGRYDEQMGRQALRRGAVDYLLKTETRSGSLLRSIEYALERSRINAELEAHRQNLENLVEKRTNELRQSQKRYLELFDHMSSGVAVYEVKEQGEDFVFKDINQAGQRLSRVDKEQVIGRSLLECLPGIKEFGLFEVFQKVWRDGKPRHHPTSLYQDQKLTRWYDNYVYKLPTGEIVAVYDDVSARIQAEDALRKSKEYLTAIIDRIADLIFVKDERHRWILVNDKFCEIAGKPREELLGKSDYDFFPKEEADVFWRKDEEVLSTGKENFNEECLTNSSTGETIFLDTKKSLYENEEGEKFIVGVGRDVTERQKVMDALKASERRYRATFEQAPVGIDHVDAEGKILEVNKKLCQMLGYAHEELTDKNVSEIIHPQDVEPSRIRFQKLKDKQVDFYNTQKRYLRKDGSVLWANLTVSAVEDAAGDIAYIVGIFEDITAQKQAQMALQASEERYRGLIEACPFSILVYDEKGNVINANPAFGHLFGWSLDEIQGRQMDFVPDECQAETEQAVANMLAGQPVIDFSTKRLTKNGQVLDVEISATRYLNAEGELAGYVVFLRDTTERKLLEKKLKDNERNLRKILESIHTGIVAIDIDSHTIQYVNPVALKMIGLPHKKVLGRVCHHFICPKEKGSCPILDLRKTLDSSEKVLLNAKGEEIPILKTVVPAELGGKNFLIESFLDITELKKSQQESLARRSLEAVIETAGSVCHEFNQPLQAILSTTEAAMADLDKENALSRDLEQILANTDKLMEITRKLSNITDYQTTDYSESSKILDLDKSSS